jgi:protein-S-isoprenylcysteine O-methyltransferase Ste14
MAATALVLYLLFAALGFGWRTWAHYRRTGSTGFEGVSGARGSAEWWAGVGFAVAMVLGVAAPLLQLARVVEPVAYLDNPLVSIVGAVLAAAGIVGTLYAQHEMGESWRIGVDAAETTTLVRQGIFGVVRNPIFTAMVGFGAGVTLLAPNPLALVGFVVLVASIEAQVRIVEEPYLEATHGEAYRSYTAAVGRFVPGVGRTR